MEKVTMEAEVRQQNASAKKLKKEGKIPAVIYGKETKTMPIEIRIKDIEKTVKTLQEGTILITLKLTDHDKKEEKTVIIKEVSRHPITDEIVHADLHAVSDNKKGRFEVPVFTSGLP
ncbi:MAG TPA: 50S ribosomal protein L25, partial [Candidatus Goldiibacteriota bacterium]|nr:50S ribosomal protein L25 [Candidatus Goldiibacteriota bacterium]